MTEPLKTPDPIEFLKSLWGPLGYPLPGLATPTLSVEDIDKRISDLKSVETWLNLNLNVLRMTIQGLEMQKASLTMMKDGIAQSTKAMQGAMPGSQESLAAQEAWWNMLRQFQQAATPPAPGQDSGTGKK